MIDLLDMLGQLSRIRPPHGKDEITHGMSSFADSYFSASLNHIINQGTVEDTTNNAK